jgi:phosphopantetheinyl transferase
MVQLTRDNQTVYCELDHIDNYDLKELIFYTDAWCEKLMENIRKKESLLARLLIDKIAKQYLKKSIFQLGFTKSIQGAPYFSSKPEIYLSITHSHGFVGVTVATTPLGIDFEKIDENNYQELQIAFDEEDWAVVENSKIEVFKYFSLKEAYSKMIGTGFTTEPSLIKMNQLQKNSYVQFFEHNGDQYLISMIVENGCLLESLDFSNNYLYKIIK